MKIYKFMLVSFLAIMTLIPYSCQKEDERYIHTDTTISSIYIRNEVGGTYVEGTFSGDNEIVFEISKARSTELDISNLLIYANIPVSASVSPGFAGRHDLSSAKEFTVTNDNNVPHTYSLRAIYLDN
jgi:hypothetical protein